MTSPLLQVEVSKKQQRVRIVGECRRSIEPRPRVRQAMDSHVKRRSKEDDVALRADLLLQGVGERFERREVCRPSGERGVRVQAIGQPDGRLRIRRAGCRAQRSDIGFERCEVDVEVRAARGSVLQAGRDGGADAHRQHRQRRKGQRQAPALDLDQRTAATPAASQRGLHGQAVD